MTKRKQTTGERITASVYWKYGAWTEQQRFEGNRLARRIDRAIREAERRGYERAKREERERRAIIASDECDAKGEAAAYD